MPVLRRRSAANDDPGSDDDNGGSHNAAADIHFDDVDNDVHQHHDNRCSDNAAPIDDNLCAAVDDNLCSATVHDHNNRWSYDH